MIAGVSEVAAQLLALIAIAGGGGCWLWLATGRPPAARGQAWLWFFLAGFALASLLLQSLIYCGVPLRVSTWPVLGLALTGWLLLVLRWRQTGFAWSGGMRREIGAALAVFVLALAGQSPPLLQHGPERFYGTGSYDQGTYVVLGDLLVDTPLAVEADTVGYRPWLVPALAVKETRITQSVLLGAVAVATRTNSQEAYGATDLFLVALAGLATMGCLRTMGTPRWFAACAGLAAALAPAVTRVHLEGYLSQVASLFVYPALVGIFGGKGPLRRETIVTGALLLAYLASIYSEVSVFGFGLVGVLVCGKEPSWHRRVRTLLLILLGVLLLNPGYWGRMALFLFAQFKAAREATGYAGLFPDSGSLPGWGRLFFDGPWPLATTIAGLAWGTLALLGVYRLIRTRRVALAVAFGLAVAALVILRLQPRFPGYAFAKLCIQFTPLWIGTGFVGLLLLITPRQSQRWAGRGVALILAGLCWWGGQPQRQRVMRPEGMLAQLVSDRLQAVRQAVEAHPERAYLVACDDPILALWLCYFGRHSEVVVDRRTVGDRILTTEVYECRRWTGPRENLFWLDAERSGKVAAYEPAPTLAIEGAVTAGRTGQGQYYAVGTGLDLIFQRPTGGAPRPIWLDFVVVPLGTNRSCQLELVDPAGRRWRTEVHGAAWCRWPVTAGAGSTRFRLSLGKGAPAGDQPAAILKLFSVEVASSLPAWQQVPVADFVPAADRAQ